MFHSPAAHDNLLLEPVLGAAVAGQPRLPVVGFAADHQTVEEEDVALVFGPDFCQSSFHDELVAALANVFAFPAIDIFLDFVHFLDGQVFASDLPVIEATHRLP